MKRKTTPKEAHSASEPSKQRGERLQGAIADIGATSKEAEDTRSLAEMTTNPSAKRLLLEVAEIQDQIVAKSD